MDTKQHTNTAEDPADRYLDLWERNQSEIARRGPPDPPPKPG